MKIEIFKSTIPLQKIREMAQESFGDMVKAVVDVEQKTIAVGGELHADAEALLLEQGSKQRDLWGINLYPEKDTARVEFSSFINIRPSQGNRSMQIQDETIQTKILTLVKERIQ